MLKNKNHKTLPKKKILIGAVIAIIAIIVAIGTGGHTYVLIAGGILLVMIALACGVYVVKKVED